MFSKAQSDINKERDNYQISIRKRLNESLQAKFREKVHNSNVPELKVFNLMIKLQNIQLEQKVTIQQTLQMLVVEPKISLSIHTLDTLINIILKIDYEQSFLVLEVIQLWLRNECYPVDKQVLQYNIIRLLQLRSEIDNDKYQIILKICNQLLRRSNLLAKTFFNNGLLISLIPQLAQYKSKKIVQCVLETIFTADSNSKQHKKSSLTNIVPFLSKIIMQQQNYSLRSLQLTSNIIVSGINHNNIELSCLTRGTILLKHFIANLNTESQQLKISMLDIIGLIVFKSDKTHILLSLGLLDGLLNCIKQSSQQIFYKVLWITGNFVVDPLFQYDIFLEHPLFIQLIKIYNQQYDKNTFNQVLEVNISNILVNMISNSDKNKVWIIVLQYQLLDKLFLNSQYRSYQQLYSSLQVLNGMLQFVMDMQKQTMMALVSSLNKYNALERLSTFRQSQLLSSVIFKIDNLISIAQ